MNEPTPAPGRLDNPTDQRLRRCERLRRRTDFDRVFKSGARGGNRVVRVALVANDLKLRRVGFAVGKRFGNAVRRNLTKRRMREAFRRLKDKLPESVDLVLMPSRDCPRPTLDELLAALPEAVERTARRLHKQGRRRARRERRTAQPEAGAGESASAGSNPAVDAVTDAVTESGAGS